MRRKAICTKTMKVSDSWDVWRGRNNAVEGWRKKNATTLNTQGQVLRLYCLDHTLCFSILHIYVINFFLLFCREYS